MLCFVNTNKRVLHTQSTQVYNPMELKRRRFSLLLRRHSRCLFDSSKIVFFIGIQKQCTHPPFPLCMLDSRQNSKASVCARHDMFCVSSYLISLWNEENHTLFCHCVAVYYTHIREWIYVEQNIINEIKFIRKYNKCFELTISSACWQRYTTADTKQQLLGIKKKRKGETQNAILAECSQEIRCRQSEFNLTV